MYGMEVINTGILMMIKKIPYGLEKLLGSNYGNLINVRS